VRATPTGGERAPGFELTTVDGGTVSLAELLGKPVVVEFFASWCPSCKENAEHLVRVNETFGDQVRIVPIDVDPSESADAIREFVDRYGITWPVAVDEQGEVSSAYGVGRLSTEVLIGSEGTIRHVETGVADHDRVVGILEDLVEGPT
jgi:peroxiredoxin